MQNNCIKNLLNLKEVIVKNVKNLKDSVEVYIELPVCEQICPHCGTKTSYIHAYYTQPVKDIPIYFKPTTLIFKKPRYECKNCGKTFYSKNEIVNKYARKTSRLTGYIVNELRNLVVASDISKKVKVSPSFSSKLLPFLAVTNTKLPKVLCIDEFKENAGNYKYQVALIDGETHEVVDIIKCRHKYVLCDYFKKFPKEQLEQLEYMLINYSENLRIAYREKEYLLDIIHSTESSDIRKQQFNEWVKRNLESSVSQLIDCAKTYQHWSIEIKNSLEVPYSNGPIEGFNNKIKTLKRATFGIHNFKARIMLLNRG